MFTHYEVHTTENPDNEQDWDASEHSELTDARNAFHRAEDDGLNAILYKVVNGSFDVLEVSTPEQP